MATGRKGSKQFPSRTPTAPSRTPTAPPTDAASSSSGTDLVAIARGLAAAVSEHGLTELIIDTPEATFTVRRGGVPMVALASAPQPVVTHHAAPAVAAAAPSMLAPTPKPVEDDNIHVVKSPFVGTFYRRANPDSPEYVKVNDRVKKGSVLCIIEAMKLMNEIESDLGGTLLAVLAEDGAPVEYDQPLFKIALA